MTLLKGRSKARSCFLAAFVLWVMATLLLMMHRTGESTSGGSAGQQLIGQLADRINKQSRELQQLLAESRQLAVALQSRSEIAGSGTAAPEKNLDSTRIQMASLSPTDGLPSEIAVLVIACNRPTVRRNLDQIFKFMPSTGPHKFQVVVSQDCGDAATTEVIQSYGNRLTFIRQPDQSQIDVPGKERNMLGYYKISRHFRWAFDQVFLRLNYSSAIVVEDDLDIAPDFFDYFVHLGRVMSQDPSIWCVSAWNDNGKTDLIDKSRADLFYRTDFFPGLGWMLMRQTWLELRLAWPAAYWDDHMRKVGVRKGRVCLRPEVSRSYTFGRVGVSNGQFYDNYLKYIELSHQPVDYSSLKLDYLLKANYDTHYLAKVYDLPLVTLDAALTTGGSAPREVRVQYDGPKEFVSMATRLKIMPDFKDGVPRCAYNGVVPVYKAGRRIYLAPGLPWRGYDVTWK